MKLNKLPNSPKVVVVFEEFLDDHIIENFNDYPTERLKLILEVATMFKCRRTAYNMWEFPDTETAEKFMFTFNLKNGIQT